jgi:CheY-like chemotaxis protein
VDSVKGSGTVFTIHLPTCEINIGSLEEPQLTVAAAPLSILVIDDEESVRETLADMLAALSHKVELAASGQDALGMLASRNFDLVFTDLAMPEMDGWETAREIRKRWPEIKILLVTGYGPNTSPPSGEDQLVDGIIGKPFDFAQIINAIAELRGQKPELQNVGA